MENSGRGRAGASEGLQPGSEKAPEAEVAQPAQPEVRPRGIALQLCGCSFSATAQGKENLKKHFNFFTCLKRAENRVDPSKDHFKFITSLWVNWKYFCVQSIVQAQFAARFRLGIANQWRLKLIRQSSTLQVKIHRERLKRL